MVENMEDKLQRSRFLYGDDVKKERAYFCNCRGIVKTVMAAAKPTCDQCGQSMSPTRRLSIKMFRKMVRNHAAQEVNGFLVDVQTAHAIVTVYDNLQNPTNKAKLLTLPINELGVKIWELFK